MSLFGREHGVKHGQGGMATSEMLNRRRLDRISQVTSDIYDLKNDPYLMKTSLGYYECKLCYTTHKTIENYIMHTEGKKHKSNLALREQILMKQNKTGADDRKVLTPPANVSNKPRIGLPGFKIVKQYDQVEGYHSLLFRLEYPLIEKGLRPRYRILSAYEQKLESIDEQFQYIVFAADPYNNVGFKIPNIPVDKASPKLITHWEPDTFTFTLQLPFKDGFNSKYRRMQEQKQMKQQQQLVEEQQQHHQQQQQYDQSELYGNGMNDYSAYYN